MFYQPEGTDRRTLGRCKISWAASRSRSDLKIVVLCCPLVDKLGIALRDFIGLGKNWWRVNEWGGETVVPRREGLNC